MIKFIKHIFKTECNSKSTKIKSNISLEHRSSMEEDNHRHIDPWLETQDQQALSNPTLTQTTSQTVSQSKEPA